MKNLNFKNAYFFDLPLSDVYAAACSAFRMTYHGDDAGAFGSRKKEVVDLDQVQSFQISLKHRTVQALSDEHDYYLVYYRRNLNVNLWSRQFRQNFPGLTRRVKVSAHSSLLPNRLRKLHIKSDRSLHMAKYDTMVPTDDCVPLEYMKQFDDLFEGFLIRCDKNFSMETRIFDNQGLVLTECRDATRASKTATRVMIYTDTQTGKEILEEKARIAELNRMVEVVSLRKVGKLVNWDDEQADELSYEQADDQEGVKKYA